MVARMAFRNREMSFWQPVQRNAPGFIQMFGLIEGLIDLKPKRQKDITPFIVAGLERYQAQAGNPFADGSDYRFNAGIAAKFAVAGNLVLDLTILPDFGQVEADPSEVNLSAFESFFEEKVCIKTVVDFLFISNEFPAANL